MIKNVKLSLILRGIIFAAIGILCLSYPKGTLESVSWVIGICLIIAAIISFFTGRGKATKRPSTMNLIAAVLMVVMGVLVIIKPQIIALLLGVFIVYEGIEFIVTALRYRRAGMKHWLLLLILSILVILFGIWAITSPLVGATLISWVIGIGILALAADCFAALYGINRVQSFFSPDTKDISYQEVN